MDLSRSLLRTSFAAAAVLVVVGVGIPQIASATGSSSPSGGAKRNPSPSPTSTSTPTSTPTPTPTASSTGYFVVGQAQNIPASSTPAPAVIASTATLSAGNYIATATADFFDYEATSNGNVGASCHLQLASGEQPSFDAVQRIPTASDGSVSITWAFTNVAATDSIVLACQVQADYSMQVSHSAITVVPVAAIG